MKTCQDRELIIPDQDLKLFNRKGYVEISSRILRRSPLLFKRIVGCGAVVQLDYNHMNDISTCYIFHPEFRELREGEAIPKYEVEIAWPENAESYDECTVKYKEELGK